MENSPDYHPEKYKRTKGGWSLVGFNPTKKIEFLDHFRQMGSITGAMERTGLNPMTFYRAMKKDPQFMEDFLATKKAMKHTVEGVMYQRALDPKGTLDRLAWLRKNYPDEYSNSVRITQDKPRHDMDSLYSKAIDANIVLDNNSQKHSYNPIDDLRGIDP